MENKPVKPQNKKGSTKDGLIGIATIIVLILLVVGAFHLFGSSKHPTKTTANTNSQNKLPAATYKVAAWEKQNNSIFSLFSQDMTSIGNDEKAANANNVSSDCAQLQVDVATAQKYPAIPNPGINKYWEDMLTNLNAAGKDCESGAFNSDASLLQRSNTELSKATSDLSTITPALQLATKEVNSN